MTGPARCRLKSRTVSLACAGPPARTCPAPFPTQIPLGIVFQGQRPGKAPCWLGREPGDGGSECRREQHFGGTPGHRAPARAMEAPTTTTTRPGTARTVGPSPLSLQPASPPPQEGSWDTKSTIHGDPKLGGPANYCGCGLPHQERSRVGIACSHSATAGWVVCVCVIQPSPGKIIPRTTANGCSREETQISRIAVQPRRRGGHGLCARTLVYFVINWRQVLLDCLLHAECVASEWFMTWEQRRSLPFVHSYLVARDRTRVSVLKNNPQDPVRLWMLRRSDPHGRDAGITLTLFSGQMRPGVLKSCKGPREARRPSSRPPRRLER